MNQVGPDNAFRKKKYKGDANAKDYWPTKSKNGGGGGLGASEFMPGHTSFGDQQKFLWNGLGFILGIADPNRAGNLPTTERYQLGNTAQVKDIT